MRILLFPDDVGGNHSGSFSARATIRQLRTLGHDVAAIDRRGLMPATGDDGVRYFAAPTALRWHEHFASSKLSSWFARSCDEFQPDYFIMAGGIQKPAILARRARKRGIKTAFLFYINDFYCHKIYSGLATGPCVACARLPELPALRHGCASAPSIAHFLKGALVRSAVRREMRLADRILGYGDDQNDIYALSGVRRERIRRITFQFDPSELDALEPRDEGYFAVTGQLLVQKGAHLLAGIVSRLDAATNVRVSIPDLQAAQQAIAQFGWAGLMSEGRLEVVTGLRSRADYLAFLAGCRGLILPSYYPTTGEFVLQEALYLGKPVLGFHVGVHKDILRDGDNAMIAAPGDLEGFADRVRRIDGDAQLRQAVAAEARQTSLRFYDQDAFDLWNEALA